MSKKLTKEEKAEILRHSTSHVLAAAVLEMFPEAKFAIGPAIENGFYYDFELPRTLIPEDLEIIEEKMKKIISENHPFEKQTIPAEKAKELFREAKQGYKVELIEDLEEEGEDHVSVYRSGPFVDLCTGPHLESTGEIDAAAFKLTKISGAYWKGDEKRQQLQRIYGVAFANKKELKRYLHMMEEAKKRDHRKLGKELELFTFSDQIGAGLPLWLPKGMVIKQQLEKWGMETEKKWGYKAVSTPFITKKKLFETSGHVPYFEDEMYKVEVPGEDKEDYFIRPMNCPFHHMVYKSKKRSYRELPLKIAEYGTVARYEQAGTLNGILRPRVFCQNDAHVYCTEEQAVDVFVEIIDLHRYYYDSLGLKDYYIVLALRDPEKKDKYHGDEEMWKKSEEMSIKAMDKAGIKYVVENEGAAHYGPKMDFKIKSVIGTEYGISTNQIDLYMPQRFDLKYIDKNGEEKYAVVQHRAPLGSSERFVGFLIEHYAGAFPTWLSPVQVAVIPVSEKFTEYAQKVKEQLFESEVRVELDDSDDSLGKRIAEATKQKIPYMLVVGEKEEKEGTVAVREREGEKQVVMKLEEFEEKIKKEISERK